MGRVVIPSEKEIQFYLERCRVLAMKAIGKVSPNPMVGAVLVHNEYSIGEGYHEYYGGPHAEVNCLASVAPIHQAAISESVLYVSLEPCNHYGKTPPCTEAIIKAGISVVVIGCTDTHALVAGNGINRLRESGVTVLESSSPAIERWMNRRFFTLHEKKRPYVILKWAQSTDGYMGYAGEQTPLTGKAANTLVHQWRSEEDAIWVGYRTALIDNPELTVRHVEGRNPIRMVYDRDGTLPNHLHLFQSDAVTRYYHSSHRAQGIHVSMETWLEDILLDAAKNGISSVLVEGGPALLSALITRGLWDEARVITVDKLLHHGNVAPKLSVQPTQEMNLGTDRLQHYFRLGQYQF
jgi:diaminohydroxyphosphoribosylaminopyrimidine deaminase/5-amino-6-(5-phosphoribosylamino)uracil reductase